MWAVPIGGEASLGVFAEKPDEVWYDSCKGNFVSPFPGPFCWGDPERVGPAPKGKGRFVGGNLQGEPTKQSHAVPAGRRALTPKQSPIEEGRKAGYGTARTELQI